jgi:hypothetical protein
VDKQGSVKVADFGLSRDIYEQEYYRTEDSKNPLPIRWMAVESLDSRIFTTKSDVVSEIKKLKPEGKRETENWENQECIRMHIVHEVKHRYLLISCCVMPDWFDLLLVIVYLAPHAGVLRKIAGKHSIALEQYTTT